MHKCQNKSVGNVYHLEQLVGQFFPYSQKQLGFDQPVTITFQSDDENASKMLGKTAYYDPSALEVVLYTDNRHPKDVMRSLSHELVHHAQNCRGDFQSDEETHEGYAQRNPHLRKMEREAYTKGNLIFRDFEDLIKTGKINIEIDFSNSGEPKMSLKEWKNNEINTKLMKKWGFLKEDKSLEEGGSGDEHSQFDKKEREDELEEGTFGGGREKKWDRIAKGLDPSSDPAPHGEEEEAAAADFKASAGIDKGKPVGRRPRRRSTADALKGSWKPVVQEDHEEMEEGAADWKAMADAPDDPTDVPTASALEKSRTKKRGEWGKKVRGKSDIRGKRGKPVAAGSKNIMTMGEGGKISVREAKEITRRIIERIRKEGK